ncbi:GNAT family N-acetyltransferase [Maritalea mediterranea]|uniref:GNAT family N-acetyltransferase n=1 Tax=Maritalea mediterranea TaxID=2909667 RepID=A0ABS9E3F8_9HYPH|nr:GNAT family N-acetyltransferase [Maritalea mediterranea]MCF4097318.1 GNAT family N-acetyltransferase [Maritalea mediterranea]
MDLPKGYRLRAVRESDLDIVCAHRELMFSDEGKRTRDSLEKMTAYFRPWLQERLGDGRYFGFIIEREGEAVAGIGQWIIDWAPHFHHEEEAHRGYIANVYVDPNHRGKGLAKFLVSCAEQEFKARGVSTMVLHASRAGERLYEALGWDQTSEMMKIID